MDDYRLQDPAEELDHPMNWEDWLQDGETITSVEFAITPDESPTLLSTNSPAFTDDTSAVTVSGIEFGVIYRLQHTIGTNAGRTASRSLTIRGARR